MAVVRTHRAGGAVAEEETERQWRRRPVVVELVESAAEAWVRDEAAPALAHEYSVDEARGCVRREAEQDLLHELVHQRRQPRRRHVADRIEGLSCRWNRTEPYVPCTLACTVLLSYVNS